MRDYLYAWNCPTERYFVASGIEFRDFAPLLSTGGIVLLKHSADATEHDAGSRLDYLTASQISSLSDEDIYGWGDFIWADYSAHDFPALPKEALAEVLYFAHAGSPLRNTRIECLGNRFLTYSHDDGWFLKTFYDDWSDIARLLAIAAPSLSTQDITELQKGDNAFWSQGDQKSAEIMTLNIDSILNRRLKPA